MPTLKTFIPALKKIRTQALLLLSTLVMFSTASNPAVWALSDNDVRAIRDGYGYYDPFATPCGAQAENSNATVASGSTLPSGPGTELEGHRLPASIGGSGNEEEAGIVGNRIELIEGRDKGNPLALFPKGVTDQDVKFYINMRWRYAVWAWSGDSKSGPEDVSWYTQKVRKVLVTNPKTGRGIVTSIVESGPAPWTGTNYGRHDTPAYWPGYYDGTPTAYKGRVSGLSPSAFIALADTESAGSKEAALTKAKELLQRRPDNIDNDLTYQWAPDQNMPAGTIVQGNQVVGVAGGNSIECTGGSGVGSFVFYSQYDPKWRDECYGGGTKGDCTYADIAQAGCGPSSLAMVVATLKDSSVTPKTVADYSTSKGWYIPGNGSSWDLLRYGPAKYGLKSQSIGTDLDQAISAIKNGALVIASGTGESPFTGQWVIENGRRVAKGGHILVIRGVTESGKLLIGDSNVKVPADKALNNTKEWDPATIKANLKGLWIITKEG